MGTDEWTPFRKESNCSRLLLRFHVDTHTELARQLWPPVFNGRVDAWGHPTFVVRIADGTAELGFQCRDDGEADMVVRLDRSPQEEARAPILWTNRLQETIACKASLVTLIAIRRGRISTDDFMGIADLCRDLADCVGQRHALNQALAKDGLNRREAHMLTDRLLCMRIRSEELDEAEITLALQRFHDTKD